MIMNLGCVTMMESIVMMMESIWILRLTPEQQRPDWGCETLLSTQTPDSSASGE